MAMAGGYHGAVPTEGACLLPSFPWRSFSSVAVTTTCPRKAGEKLLWPVAMSTMLPLPAQSRILVGMATPSEHPEVLGGGQALWRRHCGCSGDGNSCAEVCERTEKSCAVIRLFGKPCFVASSVFLEAKIFP